MLKAKQTCSFLWGLQLDLESQVKNWLQIIKQNHDPEDLYNLTDLYEVASFVLKGSTPLASLNYAPLALVTSQLEIKTKAHTEIQALKSMFAKLTEMFKNLLQQSNQRNLGPPPTCASGEVISKCNFCGVPGHFMQECKIMQEYMQLGKCKHNAEGKIVLPLGTVIPQHITDAWLCNCIDKYHQMNPGQTMAVQMLLEIGMPNAPTTSAYPEASQFSVSKVVHFEPEVGQPGMYAYK